jgi:hypothetical protein
MGAVAEWFHPRKRLKTRGLEPLLYYVHGPGERLRAPVAPSRKDKVMAAFRNEHRRFTYRGRPFHFVSYEAQSANPRKNQPAMPATWYLLSSGNRWPAIPLEVGRTDEELDAQLSKWLDTEVFA